MSTTFGVIKESKDGSTHEVIEIARRVGTKNGAKMFFTNPLANHLPDEVSVEALDNSPQGIFTIGDIKRHISRQEKE